VSVYDLAVWYLWAVPFLTVAALIALVVYITRQPLPKPVSGFALVEPSLERLLKQGLESGSLTIRHKKSSKVIEFRKYIRAEGDYSVALRFPDTEQLKPAYARFKAHCEENGILHRIGTAEQGGVVEVLSVDCGHDLDKALNLATTIWTRIYLLATQAPCAVKLRDCDVWCDLVDSPNHDPTISIRKFNQQQKQEGGVTIPGCLMVTTLVLMLLTSLFGLPIATLASLGEPPDWSLAPGGVAASGGTGSLIFACVFLVSYAAMQFASKSERERTNSWIRRNRWIRLLHVFVHLGLMTLIASVVFVWLGP